MSTWPALKLRIGLACAVGVAWLVVPALASASAVPKVVALTFDDGPYGTSTQEVLDILNREGVHATFFLIGQQAAKYPALAKEEVADGEVIGNHTWDHPNLLHLSWARVQAQVSKTEAIIASTTGVHATLFRPPYGNLTKQFRKKLEGEGYAVKLWNVDPEDWNYASTTSDMIVQNIMSHLKPRMVIILHDGRDTHVGYPRDNLIRALPALIEDLKEKGYTFVTL